MIDHSRSQSHWLPHVDVTTTQRCCISTDAVPLNAVVQTSPRADPPLSTKESLEKCERWNAVIYDKVSCDSPVVVVIVVVVVSPLCISLCFIFLLFSILSLLNPLPNISELLLHTPHQLSADH